jgi:hypothetical protein
VVVCELDRGCQSTILENDREVEALLGGTIGLFIVRLTVPKHWYRNLSGKTSLAACVRCGINGSDGYALNPYSYTTLLETLRGDCRHRVPFWILPDM